MRAILDHTEDVAAHIRTFWFKPDHSVRYIAGQFTELYLPHDNHDDRGIKRWFTLSSSPTDQLLSITTKFVPEGGSTFKQTLYDLPLGTSVILADPMGDFVLPKDKTIPLVFVAGGIGVTPMHSMIKWLVDTGEKRPVTLLYAAGHVDEIAFAPLFKKYLGKRYVPIVKEPARTWRGQTGGLDAARILALAPDDGKALYYISGPEPMVEAFSKDLHTAGVPKHRVVGDFFPGYLQP